MASLPHSSFFSYLIFCYFAYLLEFQANGGRVPEEGDSILLILGFKDLGDIFLDSSFSDASV